MDIIDLRSDTITRPTPAMRKAMAEAEVGDDVFKEDPTVNHLEELAAQRMAKPAALLVGSGTMGNLVSQLTHCGRGDETILGRPVACFLLRTGRGVCPGWHPSADPSQRHGRHHGSGEDRGGHSTR
jgi:threonine aldolase